MSYPADFAVTLVQAGTIALQSLKKPNQAIDCVYTEHDAGLCQFGETVKLNIPVVNVANATDIGVTPLTYTAPTDTSVSLAITSKFSSTRQIFDFYQVQSNPIRLAELYLNPLIEEVTQRLNLSTVALMTAANFNVHATTTGGDDVFTRAHLATARAKMSAIGVPVNDGNMNWLNHSVVYGNMLGSTEFVNQTSQGERSVSMNESGLLLNQFGVRLREEPDMPLTTVGVYTSLLLHKYAIGLRTTVADKPVVDNVLQTVVYIRDNVPVNIQVTWDFNSQSTIIHAFIMAGLGVIRPNYAAFMTTI